MPSSLASGSDDEDVVDASPGEPSGAKRARKSGSSARRQPSRDPHPRGEDLNRDGGADEDADRAFLEETLGNAAAAARVASAARGDADASASARGSKKAKTTVPRRSPRGKAKASAPKNKNKNATRSATNEKTKHPFFAVYFEEPDASGHKHGPHAEETKAAVRSVDDAMRRLRLAAGRADDAFGAGDGEARLAATRGASSPGAAASGDAEGARTGVARVRRGASARDCEDHACRERLRREMVP